VNVTNIVTIRRITQAFFLLLFFWLCAVRRMVTMFVTFTPPSGTPG